MAAGSSRWSRWSRWSRDTLSFGFAWHVYREVIRHRYQLLDRHCRLGAASTKLQPRRCCLPIMARMASAIVDLGSIELAVSR